MNQKNLTNVRFSRFDSEHKVVDDKFVRKALIGIGKIPEPYVWQ